MENLSARNLLHEYGEELLEEIPDLIQCMDVSGRFLYVNSTWKQVLGYSQDDINDISFFDIIHPAYQEHCKLCFQKVLSGENVDNINVTFLSKSKEPIFLEGFVRVKKDNHGSIVSILAYFKDVTSKKKAEEKILEQTKQLEVMFHQSLLGMFIMKLDEPIEWNNDSDKEKLLDYAVEHLRVLRVNGALAKQYGVDENFFINKNFKFLFSKNLKKGRKILKEILDKGKLHIEMNEKLPPDFKEQWTETDHVCLYDEQERVIGSFGIQKIITDRKENQEKSEFLNLVLMNVSDAIIIMDEELTIIYGNKKTEELFGYSMEEIIGQSPEVFLNSNLNGNFKEILSNVLLKEQLFKGARNHIRKDGSEFYCDFKIASLNLENGEKHYVGIYRDITENKKMVNKINNINKRYNQLAEQIKLMAWEVDAEGLYTYVSPVVYDLLGYSPGEVVGKKYYYDFFPEDRREVLKKETLEEFKNKKSFTDFVNPLARKDGKIIYVNTSAIPMVDREGNLLGYRGTDNDVSEKEGLRKKLENEKELYRTTLLSVGDAVISTDKKGNIEVMNQVAETLTGWSQEDAYGKPFDEVFVIIDEHTRELCENFAKKALRTGKDHLMNSHTLLVSKDGKEISIEDSSSPIISKDGNINGAVIVFRDFTEKKEKQAQIEYLSFHDSLTGLYNRRYMEDAIERLDTSRNLPITIMAIDVNGLKLTNDAFGHKAGDRLLQTVADILKEACRTDDIIGRMGGDEFYIILPKTGQEVAKSIKERILQLSHDKKIDPIVVSLAVGCGIKKKEDDSIDAIKIHADNNMYKDKLKYGKSMRSDTIEIVLKNINHKYDKEQIHTERVSQYAVTIAKVMALSENEIEEIKIAGVLHDIGKIIVSPEILNKQGRLTIEEYEIMKRHPETSYQILKSVDEYMKLAEIVLYHHERWDGNGYPEGLKGEEIPLFSRILCVADAYEAMTSERSYKKPKSLEEVILEFKRCSGTQFDPNIVKVFIEKVLT